MEEKKSESPIRVLMVEDDADLCRGWMDLFEIIGYSARCHQRALETLADRKSILDCDVLITDYYLPDLNGIELIRRSREINPSLPAILLTGSRESIIVEAVRNLRMCTVMHKPINIDDLEKKISEIVRVP